MLNKPDKIILVCFSDLEKYRRKLSCCRNKVGTEDQCHNHEVLRKSREVFKPDPITWNLVVSIWRHKCSELKQISP